MTKCMRVWLERRRQSGGTQRAHAALGARARRGSVGPEGLPKGFPAGVDCKTNSGSPHDSVRKAISFIQIGAESGAFVTRSIGAGSSRGSSTLSA